MYSVLFPDASRNNNSFHISFLSLATYSISEFVFFLRLSVKHYCHYLLNCCRSSDYGVSCFADCCFLCVVPNGKQEVCSERERGLVDGFAFVSHLCFPPTHTLATSAQQCLLIPAVSRRLWSSGLLSCPPPSPCPAKKWMSVYVGEEQDHHSNRSSVELMPARDFPPISNSNLMPPLRIARIVQLGTGLEVKVNIGMLILSVGFVFINWFVRYIFT